MDQHPWHDALPQAFSNIRRLNDVVDRKGHSEFREIPGSDQLCTYDISLGPGRPKARFYTLIKKQGIPSDGTIWLLIMHNRVQLTQLG